MFSDACKNNDYDRQRTLTFEKIESKRKKGRHSLRFIVTDQIRDQVYCINERHQFPKIVPSKVRQDTDNRLPVPPCQQYGWCDKVVCRVNNTEVDSCDSVAYLSHTVVRLGKALNIRITTVAATITLWYAYRGLKLERGFGDMLNTETGVTSMVVSTRTWFTAY